MKLRSIFIALIFITTCHSSNFVYGSEFSFDIGTETTTILKPVFEPEANFLPNVFVPLQIKGEEVSINMEEMLKPYAMTRALNYLRMSSPYKVDNRLRKALIAILAHYKVEVDISWTTFTTQGEWDVLMRLVDGVEDAVLLQAFHEKQSGIKPIQLYSDNFGIWPVNIDGRSMIDRLFTFG